jgi:collagen type VII alpha
MSIGNNGDFYIDTLNGDYYSKIAGNWVLKGNVRGPAGPQGVQGNTGATGATGDPGAVVITADLLFGNGVPSNGLGIDSQVYVDQLADDVYKKVSGVWVLQTNIKGDKGIQGDVGATGATGAVGATGSAGGVGATGATGLTGASGATGASGSIGPQGTPGVQGNDGADGQDGQPGPPGATGLTGATGPQGPAGADGSGGGGSAGGIGVPGADGADGEQGPPGPPGATGATGPAGADGTGGAGAQAISFAADKPSSQAVTANFLTKCTFTHEISDIGGYYDAPNSKWTPPAGTVLIEAGVGFAGGPYGASTIQIGIYKNGSPLYFKNDTIPGAATPSTVISAIDTCNGTDYYEIFAASPTLTSGTANFQASQTSWFGGTVLTGYAGATGPSGPAGADGAEGEGGPPGPIGATGPAGSASTPGGSGQVITNTGLLVSLISGSNANIASITLTPGTWSISAGVKFNSNSSVSITQWGASIGTVPSTLNNSAQGFSNNVSAAISPGSAGTQQLAQSIPTQIVTVAANTTYYLVGLATFSASTLNVDGTITAVSMGSGPTGATGAVGAIGMPGVDGQDGQDGQPGPPGATGATGATGPQGTAGTITTTLFTASGTINLNAATTQVRVIGQAGGGGGGGGARFNPGTAITGGAGGAGGGRFDRTFRRSDLPANPLTVTIGAGGAGGAATGAATVAGNNGASGQPTVFGGSTLASCIVGAGGGGGGQGGVGGGNGVGGAGGCEGAAGTTGTAGVGVANPLGIGGSSTGTGGATGGVGLGTGGGAGGNPILVAGATGGGGGNSAFAAPGGGAGAGQSNANVVSLGGPGGVCGESYRGSQAQPGANNGAGGGATGQSLTPTYPYQSGFGGGGGGFGTTAGGDGGAGTQGAGGGGGAGTTAGLTGAGAAGGGGFMLVLEY